MTDGMHVPLNDEPVFHGPLGYVGPVQVVRCGQCDGWGYHEYGRCVRCKGRRVIAVPRERPSSVGVYNPTWPGANIG